MPRRARTVAPGYPHHVIQRGNNRETVFFDDEDRSVYLFLLKKYSEVWQSPIICYCLMTNHVHLLARPALGESLQKMMQGLTLCYTQHINRKRLRTGRLWESRYHSCIVDEDAYLWAVARYIEQNPLRAAIVKSPEDYMFSSAAAHMGFVQDPVLGEDLLGEGQVKEYVEFIKAGISSEHLRDIRKSTKTGRPLGTDEFLAKMERQLGRRLTALPVGRPRVRRNEKWIK